MLRVIECVDDKNKSRGRGSEHTLLVASSRDGGGAAGFDPPNSLLMIVCYISVDVACCGECSCCYFI